MGDNKKKIIVIEAIHADLFDFLVQLAQQSLLW